MEFTGEFETHLTVSLSDLDTLKRLRRWTDQRGLKCIHIILDRGERVSQPMLTWHGRGTLSAELARASGVSEGLASHGFTVNRIKIEAAPTNQDVPGTCAEALVQPRERYFEHHVKLLLSPHADHSAITEAVDQHGARLSRNALCERTDGWQERFVTQRVRRVGRSEARRRLDALLEVIAHLEHPVLDIEEEFVVYDSNASVDAGWIADEEA